MSADQRHRRGGRCSGSLRVIGGPCAACCDEWAATALGFDLRGGISWAGCLPANEKCHQPLLGIDRSKSRHVFFISSLLRNISTTFSICKHRKPSVLAYREGRSIRLIRSDLYDNSSSKVNT